MLSYRWHSGCYGAFLRYCLILGLLFQWGKAQADNGPVTTAGIITSAVPGNSYTVPVTVTGFTDIGEFTLTMEFDVRRIQFVAATTHASLPGMTVTYTPPPGNNKGRLVFSWTGSSNTSLTDGSALANLTFSYTSGSAILEWWYYSGTICRYRRYVSGSLVTLTTSPYYAYFINGGIANRGAPITKAPVIASPAQGTISVPLTVNQFSDIGAITLRLDYDSSVLTFNSFTPHSSLSSMLVSDNAGTGTTRYINVIWISSPAVTLAENSILVTLTFNYPVGGTSCDLIWFDNGPSCEYADGSNDRLIDLPTASYFINGAIGGVQNMLYAKTFLQGAYDASTHLMRTTLLSKSLVPSSQPYTISPWLYTGTEQTGTIPAGTVDWVLVELRSGTAASTVVERRAAFLMSDGSLADNDGSAGVRLNIAPSGSFYIVIYHRNHLPVMSAQPVALPNSSGTFHDFTANPAVNVYSGAFSGVIPLETGIYGQIPGELQMDNKLIYSGPGNDRGKIFAKISEVMAPATALLSNTISGYYREDLNLDGVVKYSGPQNDQAFIFSSIDQLTNPTVLTTTLPGQVPVAYP